MNIKNIPVEVMDAAHKHIPLYSKHQVLIALAAALNAWPGMSQLAENDSASIREMAALILPLPQEARDD
jgi:hypothetical protein